MPKPVELHRRIGRPPAGARAGERVKDYPQLSVRIPAETRAKLQAISVITSRAQWRLITDAIDCYLQERPDVEQQKVAELTQRLLRNGAARKPDALTSAVRRAANRPAPPPGR